VYVFGSSENNRRDDEIYRAIDENTEEVVRLENMEIGK
jgi:hypothetical protein